MSLILWPAFACCSLITLAGLAAMHADKGWGDIGNWDGPLIFAGFSLGLAALLGLLPPLAGAVLAVAPIAVVVVTTVPYWGKSVKFHGGAGAAAGSFLAGMGRRARDLALAAPRILLELPGMLRDAPAPPAASPGEGAPVITRPRRRPSTARVDPALGPAPVPEQVARELESAGVIIPPVWGALAERFANFDPEDGDDFRLFWAENAAGVLAVAEAAGGLAEDLASGHGLDPAIIAATTDAADDIADTSGAIARIVQVHDHVYQAPQEHADGGGTFPEDSPGWFGTRGTEGGAAA